MGLLILLLSDANVLMCGVGVDDVWCDWCVCGDCGDGCGVCGVGVVGVVEYVWGD